MRLCRIWLLPLVLLFVLAFSLPVTSAQLRIGVVDIQLVVSSYDRVSDFQELAEKAKEEIQSIVEDVQRGKIDSGTARVRVEAIQERLAKEQGDILDEIYAVIESIARGMGLPVVVGPFILYKDIGVQVEDVSYLVIQKLNDTYAGKEPHE